MMKMAEPTQYSFSYSEMAKLMFQSSGIHEGRWVIGFEFNVVVAPAGVKPDEAYPGAIVMANKLILSAAAEAPSPPNLTFDAAVLNPVKKK
jgi:hypothetical protein